MDIWKEAPEGATHFNPVDSEFMRIENNQWVAWIEGEWEWVIPVGEMLSKIIKRPQAEQPVYETEAAKADRELGKELKVYPAAEAQDKPQEWKDGLPPVGVECEMMYLLPQYERTESFEKVLVKSYYEGQVWFQNTDNLEVVVPLSECEFRPIKSQAEKEREEFALEMCKDSGMFGYGENLTAQDAREIYDWLKSTGRLDTKGDV